MIRFSNINRKSYLEHAFKHVLGGSTMFMLLNSTYVPHDNQVCKGH